MLHALQQAADEVELHLPVEAWFAVALVAAIVAAFLARSLDLGGRRDRTIERLALARGWRYQRDDPAGIGDLRFTMFSGARGAHVTNVVTPDAPKSRVRGFDYSLLVERTARRNESALVGSLADSVFDVDGDRDGPSVVHEPTRRRTGAVVRLDAFCPSLVAAPASMLSRAIETAGARDLDFESVAFNRGWDVRCADLRFAWLFFDASMIDLVLELGHGVSVETFGNYVLFTRDLLSDPASMLSFVSIVARVPDLVNPLVRQEYPTVTEMESRSMIDAWQNRPDGQGGRY